MGSFRVAFLALCREDTSVSFRRVLCPSGANDRLPGLVTKASRDNGNGSSHVGGRLTCFNCTASIFRAVLYQGTRVVVSTAAGVVPIRCATRRAAFVWFAFRDCNGDALAKATGSHRPRRGSPLSRRFFFVFPKGRAIGSEVCVFLFRSLFSFYLWLRRGNRVDNVEVARVVGIGVFGNGPVHAGSMGL